MSWPPPWPPIRLKTPCGRSPGLSSVHPATISRPLAVIPARIETHTGIRLVERIGRNPFRVTSERKRRSFRPITSGQAQFGGIHPGSRDKQDQAGSVQNNDARAQRPASHSAGLEQESRTIRPARQPQVNWSLVIGHWSEGDDILETDWLHREPARRPGMTPDG